LIKSASTGIGWEDIKHTIFQGGFSTNFKTYPQIFTGYPQVYWCKVCITATTEK